MPSERHKGIKGIIGGISDTDTEKELLSDLAPFLSLRACSGRPVL
jgi:hypothetical protein